MSKLIDKIGWYDCISAFICTCIHMNETNNTVKILIRDLKPYSSDSSDRLLRLIILAMPIKLAYWCYEFQVRPRDYWGIIVAFPINNHWGIVKVYQCYKFPVFLKDYWGIISTLLIDNCWDIVKVYWCYKFLLSPRDCWV